MRPQRGAGVAGVLLACAGLLLLVVAEDYEPPITQHTGKASVDFSKYTLIKPKIYHGREKKQISTTREEKGLHAHHLTINYEINGHDYVLDLRLNRELVPDNFFVRYQNEGKHVVDKPTIEDVDLCQYVGNIRGVEGSWVAISTCRGLRGVIYDGSTMHYIQNHDEDNDIEGHHYLYKHEDLISNHTCGYVGGHGHNNTHKDSFTLGKSHDEYKKINRFKRSTDDVQIRGPYNANKQSRYVELVLVVDNKEYRELGEDSAKVIHHCKDIANIINSLYTPLNIFIALVGVVVWTEYDEIVLSNNGDVTLTNFLHYRREKLVKDHPNDNAQLLTREEFEGGVVGKALKGPICTFEFSGGVAMDHSSVVGLVATTIAHEMGHNFGMEHDTEECECPEEKCIMSPSSSNLSPTHWSTCSLEYLALAFEHGMDYCLKNKPKRLFDSPVCGNGFVEPGEQCDCGLSRSCSNNFCCNPATCMLYPNATCATGECCDLQTCRPSTAGTLCRSAERECDLPEYCTGQSEFCPEDIFKMDTETCDNGKAFCYHGSCRTHTDQCRLLWGPSGNSSDEKCYEMNKKGTRHGNCGYSKLKQTFFSCQDDNIYCGMLHCRHYNERLEFGMESVAILSHSFINSKGSIIPCRTAIVDLGLNQIDPGLVPDGAKCGEGKMCVNQKCMSVDSLRLNGQLNSDSGVVCPSDCSGHGVCNSLGHCHCFKGYAPPLCDYPGPGGSLDSGPASDPDAHKDWVMLMCIGLSGIITTALLLAFLTYYSRHNAVNCWSRPSSFSKSPTKGGIQRGISRGASCLGLYSPSSSLPTTVSPTTPRLSPDDMNSSLLPVQNSSNDPSVHNNNFFGHFKGFSLTPIQKQEETFGVQNQNFGIENEQNKPFVSFSSQNQSATTSPTSTSGGNSVKSKVNKINTLNTNHKAQINMNKNANPYLASVHSPTQGQKLPQRSAPPVPSVPTVSIMLPRSNSQALNANKTLNKPESSVSEIVDKTKNIVTGVENSNPASMAPALPPNNIIITRPVISNPILEASTCTAKELMSPLKNSSNTLQTNKVPLRAAPAAPNASSPNDSKRPLSSPNSVCNSVTFVVEDQSNKKPKETNTTLNRIASFLKPEKSDKSRNPVERSNSLPKNQNQVKNLKNIDKDKLKTLQISNPILISEIDLPKNTVPVVSDSEDDNSKAVIMRAQSMRGPISPQKPKLPAFGSMRQPSGVKRPTSIPVANRPTSPPPPRPDLATQDSNQNNTTNKKIFQKLPALPGYQNPSILEKQRSLNNRKLNDSKSPEYDDCIAETHAPLANMHEESVDNIYAVIEESPPPESCNNSYNKPSPEKINKLVSSAQKAGNLNSSSSESMGLLGEIVSEIQNRNFDSIYSTSTLARKKKEQEALKAGLPLSDDEMDFDDGSSTYANTLGLKPKDNEYSNMGGVKSISSAASTTSSGYLNPAAVNVPVVPVLKLSSDNSYKEPIKSDQVDTTCKPYSSTLHRPLGPFAASYTKDKNASTNSEVTQQSQVEKTKSPPLDNNKKNIVSPTIGKFFGVSKVTSPSEASKKNLKNETQVQNNSPDLVSSCSPALKSVKSPDLVNNGNQSSVSKVSGVNQGVILKPTVPPAPSVKTQLQKPPSLSTPKPPLKPNNKSVSLDSKNVTRTAPSPPVNNGPKKVVPPRPSLPRVLQHNGSMDKSGSNSSLSSSKSSSIEKNLSNISKINTSDNDKQKPKPTLVKKNSSDNSNKLLNNKTNNVSVKPSSVASLQQKFEPPKNRVMTTVKK